MRVQRALALNPHLNLKQSRDLAKLSISASDAAIALALLKRNPHVMELLAEKPALVSSVSQRAHQPGPQLLGRRFNEATPAELTQLCNAFYPDPDRKTVELRTPQDFLRKALAAYLDDLMRDTDVVSIPTLVSIAETLMPAVGAYYYRPEIPRNYSKAIAELPGRSIIALAQTFRVHIPEEEAPTRSTSLEQGSTVTLEAVLSYPGTDQDMPLASASEYWAPHAVQLAAQWAAPKICAFQQLETFNSLANDWLDTIERLVVVASRV